MEPQGITPEQAQGISDGSLLPLPRLGRISDVQFSSRPWVDGWGGDDGQQVSNFMQKVISSASPDFVQRMISPVRAGR